MGVGIATRPTSASAHRVKTRAIHPPFLLAASRRGLSFAPVSADPSPSPGSRWEKLARHWRLLGPPFRALEEDARRIHAAWLNGQPQLPARRLDVLLLGVTPELAEHRWSADYSLTALDRSEPMLRSIWPGDGPHRRAVQGEWLQAPFPDASFDLVISDGGVVVMGSLEKAAALAHECHRLLRPGGRVAVRHFAREESQPDAEALPDAVARGEIRDFHALKMRLLLALPPAQETAGVNLPLAREAFCRLFPNRDALAHRLGCPRETIDTIDAYAGMGDYLFATPEELARIFGGFEMRQGPPASYPLAACCPVFAFPRRE
jgi:SAM-dependent methyltransferase